MKSKKQEYKCPVCGKLMDKIPKCPVCNEPMISVYDDMLKIYLWKTTCGHCKGLGIMCKD